ncbi:uncharacterized protein LOC135498810 isoform X2 [Lineus longissimus]|uniref:uncharacterized protein LOC135498810 isoform X2 n=1 Tax=Lineus longissimus TaxID=88925 RepID=UPI00315D802D
MDTGKAPAPVPPTTTTTKTNVTPPKSRDRHRRSRSSMDWDPHGELPVSSIAVDNDWFETRGKTKAGKPKKVVTVDESLPKRQTRSSTGSRVSERKYVISDSDSDDDVQVIKSTIKNPPLPKLTIKPITSGTGTKQFKSMLSQPIAPKPAPPTGGLRRTPVSMVPAPPRVQVPMPTATSRGAVRGRRGKTPSSAIPDIELLMECHDEELSASQVEHQRKMQTEFDKVSFQISRMKQDALLAGKEVSQMVPVSHGMKYFTITSQQQVAAVANGAQPRAAVPSDDSDVIIIGETPSKAGPAPPVASATNLQKQNVMTTAAGQKLVIATTPLTMSSGVQLAPTKVSQPAAQQFAGYQILKIGNQQIQIPSAQIILQQQSVQQQATTDTVAAPAPKLAPRPGPSSRTKPISGTHGLGVRLPQGQTTSLPEVRHNILKPGSWVPLDEYYYGKREGDPAYSEDKGEFRFKCWFCHKMLYNNVKLMLHMQGHIDSEKQQNLDLSDLTQCKHCFRNFDTPFEMQCHIEKVHRSSSNVLVCRICEKDHQSHQSLASHMRISHTACEMPYLCTLCNFRSSVYNDVIDHFKKLHSASAFVLCFYCLRVFKITVSKVNGWGLTQNFYQHLQKHQVKGTSKRCTACKLVFFNRAELKNHKIKDHVAHQKALLNTSGKSTTEQVMIKVKDGSSKIKSLNVQSSIQIQEYKNLHYNQNLRDLTCVECKQEMSTSDHYKKYVQCTLCRYATNCSNAYSSHMMNFHADFSNREVTLEQRMKGRMYCVCGYSSQFGNTIANHLVFCNKQTSYKNKQTPKFIFDEESNPSSVDSSISEEQPRPATLFDALGLVKRKPSDRGKSIADSPQRMVRKILHGVIDDIFPAETTAAAVLDEVVTAAYATLQQNIAAKKEAENNYEVPADPMKQKWLPTREDEDIPAALKGSQKWSAVKFKEKKAPSKRSVFLGTSDVEEDEEDQLTQTKKLKIDDNTVVMETTSPVAMETESPVAGSSREESPGMEEEDTSEIVERKDSPIIDEEELIPVVGSLVAEGDSLVAEEDSLVPEEDSVVVEEDGMVVEEDGMVVEEDSMVAEEDSMVAEEDSMVAEEDSMVTEDDGLVAKEDISMTITKNESPVIMEDSLVAEPESSVAEENDSVAKADSTEVEKEITDIKEEIPVTKEEIPVAKKDTHVAEEEVCVAKEETPVAKVETHVAKAETHVAKEEIPIAKDENKTISLGQDIRADDADERADEKTNVMDIEVQKVEETVGKKGEGREEIEERERVAETNEEGMEADVKDEVEEEEEEEEEAKDEEGTEVKAEESEIKKEEKNDASQGREEYRTKSEVDSQSHAKPESKAEKPGTPSLDSDRTVGQSVGGKGDGPEEGVERPGADCKPEGQGQIDPRSLGQGQGRAKPEDTEVEVTKSEKSDAEMSYGGRGDSEAAKFVPPPVGAATNETKRENSEKSSDYWKDDRERSRGESSSGGERRERSESRSSDDRSYDRRRDEQRSRDYDNRGDRYGRDDYRQRDYDRHGNRDYRSQDYRQGDRYHDRRDDRHRDDRHGNRDRHHRDNRHGDRDRDRDHYRQDQYRNRGNRNSGGGGYRRDYY